MTGGTARLARSANLDSRRERKPTPPGAGFLSSGLLTPFISADQAEVCNRPGLPSDPLTHRFFRARHLPELGGDEARSRRRTGASDRRPSAGPRTGNGQGTAGFGITSPQVRGQFRPNDTKSLKSGPR